MTAEHPLSTHDVSDAAYARALDEQDELAPFRQEFVVDNPDLIYLDGNSLGRLPKRTVMRMQEIVEDEWGRRLIRAWGEGWFNQPERIGAKIARLVGAADDEVIVTDSTSVDLFKLILASLQARSGRHKVVTDDLNFPSDVYVAQGALKLAGPDYHLQLVPSPDGIMAPESALLDAIDQDTALVMLTHTAFKSGYVYDMGKITAAAHRAGALMLWDLCHSVGVMPLQLGAAGADLAVGCTYKYLNSGPGAPAFLFVRKDLQDLLISPIWGWFSQKGQFDFTLDYAPTAGTRRWLAGSPPILSLSAVETGVDLVLEAGLDRLRTKSVKQTEYLIELWQALLQPLGFELNSPRAAAQRGSHVSLGHAEGLRIDRALIGDMNVIPDFRFPDNIRLGLAPLYTTFAEIHEAVLRLRDVVLQGLYEKYPVERPDVT